MDRGAWRATVHGVAQNGEGERVLALESREGTRASRRVEEGLSRSFSGGGGKPSCPSPSAGDPWTARRSNQSILKEISPACSLEGLMLKLKFQYFGHLMQRTDSLEKTLMLGRLGGRKRRGRQRRRSLDSITNTMDMGLGGLRAF